MRIPAISNGHLHVQFVTTKQAGETAYYVAAVEMQTPQGWRRLLDGRAGGEFVTTLGESNATACSIQATPEGGWIATLSGRGDGWEAREVITLAPDQPYLRREQTYRFTHDCEAAICPGFALPAAPPLRYTLPLHVWERPLADLAPMRIAVDWALPFPFHVWHDERFVAIYGLDKSDSPGTLDVAPPDASGQAVLRAYYPDMGVRQPESPAPPTPPMLSQFAAGAEVTLVEIIAAKPLEAGEEALLEAERLAAAVLLRTPPPAADLPAVADGIAAFYRRCDLWEPNALAPGRGWFSNMWVRTQIGPAKKRGEMSGYFDFGWGEGIAVEMMLGAVRHWQRTGDTTLLPYVNEMTRNMELFKRAPGDDQPYFDRCNGAQYGDFLMDIVPGSRIWTHALGHTGSQLLQLYQAAPDYPCVEARAEWLAAATCMARFFAKHQRANGDLQDIFDEHDREVNSKPHRITARAVVCGLWARLAEVSGDAAWTERALKLAHAVGPEIIRYEYYNQMLDGIVSPTVEYTDGEAAYYVLEGLVPLYAATRDPQVLALCNKAAAYGIAWSYFYHLPYAHRGIARGGQCCRMHDLPLLYPIGPAKGMTPFLELHALTGDPLFAQMAKESAHFIGNWQLHDPGQPWHGGIIHALGQYCGRHWGPDIAGQVDSGMATGNSLAALELWLASQPNSARSTAPR